MLKDENISWLEGHEFKLLNDDNKGLLYGKTIDLDFSLTVQKKVPFMLKVYLDHNTGKCEASVDVSWYHFSTDKYGYASTATATAMQEVVYMARQLLTESEKMLSEF